MDRVGWKHQDGLYILVVRTTKGGVTANDRETHIATSQGFDEVYDMPDFQGYGLHTEIEWEHCIHDE